jgi:HlyD family secretion protein
VNLKKLIGMIIGIAALALAGWGGMELYHAANSAAAGELPYTAVKRGDVTFAVYAKGDLQGGNSQMLVAPMINGDLVLTSLRQPGDMVASGDVVAEFDTTDQTYKLREAEADLAEAAEKVAQAEAQAQAKEEEDNYALLKARADLRQAELDARKNPLLGAIDAKENDLLVESARAALAQLERDLANRKATSQAGVAIQEAAVAKAKVQGEQARKNIEMMTLHAGAAGYVNVQPNMNNQFFFEGMVLPMLQVGDKVRAGMAVAQIPDTSSWEVVARLTEADRGHIALGQPVQLTSVATPERPFHGKVKDLGGTAGPVWDRRFECKISVDDPPRELRPGMTANLVITEETIRGVLWMPAQALFESDGRTFAYVRSPQGNFSPQDVKLIRRSESQVVIEGLSEGQVVALANPGKQNSKSKDSKKSGSGPALPGS